MPPSTPFFDRDAETLDTDQILAEAIPLAYLIGLFAALALLPLSIVFLLGGGSPIGALLTLLAQFVLAIGSGIVLMYAVSRGIQLAEE